ncbi:MAG: TM0106 family RecB-like putative nuclease [Gemmatimonadaceae bacterium]
MFRDQDSVLLSATDLSNFLGCRHRTGLDLAVADGLRERPFFHNPLLEVLKKRGIEHEARYVAALRSTGDSVVDLSTIENLDERARATLDAMRSGAGAIVQGTLGDGIWRGHPDVMRRVARPSALGAWSYEVADTKLARETRGGTILQLALYSDMLAAAQEAQPVQFHVITPVEIGPGDGGRHNGYHIHTHRVDDYAAYFRWIRGVMVATVALGPDQITGQFYPEPVEACRVCHWAAECARRRRADDHLSLVAGITAMQRRELESRSIATVTNLARLPLPLPFKPDRGSPSAYVRVREQARLQLASLGKTRPLHELLGIEPDRGLCRLPEPSRGDLFLDLEGDPLAVDGGREYLFGLTAVDETYRSSWALDELAERRAFEWVIDAIEAAAREHPAMHVYHYAPYEPAALKRLMGRYASRERELDAMLRAGRFVDLYAVVRQSLRAGVERYSIKNLEPLYDFKRDVELHTANRCRSYVEQALEMGAPETVSQEIRDTVERYNRDDCLSALRLRDWLERQRSTITAGGQDVPRPSLTSGDAPQSVDERSRVVEGLRSRLLAGIPVAKADRTSEQQGRWLLAYMLDYHRREQKSTWWEYFRLCALDETELLEERGAVAGLELVERTATLRHQKTNKLTGAVIDRYQYPPQEMEIEEGDELRVQDPGARPLGTVVAMDRIARTMDVHKAKTRADLHPRALFAFTHLPTTVIEDALVRIAETAAKGDSGFHAARALLAVAPPRVMNQEFGQQSGESAGHRAVRIAGALDQTVLAVQGPPGSGKTYWGARMICELVRQGKRVGITATSHSVIRRLLEETGAAAREDGVTIRLAHKVGNNDGNHAAVGIECFDDNANAAHALGGGAVDVLGGTAWLWTRAEFASSVDVLFVDEAGQMALPNVVAVSQAANSVVLLGDPRQLEQPQRGTHPDGVDVSALDHILGDRQTISDDHGIFLAETWRLAPAVCRFTSEVFYDGRLTPRPGLERQRVVAAAGIPESGLALLSVLHGGNTSRSNEEVEAVAWLLSRLTADGAKWIDVNGDARPMSASDVLVVAPYNRQVNCLTERLTSAGARIGTVDRFQGQEAPVAIYSMTTSRPEDAPRGMEFLYSLNRLNVATSRARCLAIVVASPLLFEADCRTPHQMQLVNALCRFKELAHEIRLQ